MRTRLMFAILALLACSFFGTDKAAAATPEDVAEAMRLLGDEAKYHPRVSAFKTYDDGAMQTVFVARNERYTCYLSFGEGDALNPRPGFLSVWVRRNGTSGQAKLLTFSDERADGEVDFGIRGPIDADDSTRKYFRSNVSSADSDWPVVGVEHRAYWQELYDRAISEILRRLRHPGDRYFRGKMWHR